MDDGSSDDSDVQFIKFQRARPLKKPNEDKHWPTDTRLIRPATGKIRLNQQLSLIQRVAQEAIQNLFISLLWINSFPDLILRSKFSREGLYKAACDLKCEAIQRRMQSDIEYVDTLSAIVSISFALWPQ